MIFETRSGGHFCPGRDHALDGRRLTALSRHELVAELQWREEQLRAEVERCKRIDNDIISDLRQRNRELEWWLTWLAGWDSDVQH